MDPITPTTGSQEFSFTGALGGNGTQATQEQFLSLLVTQLKNQNPFEPIKNEDFLTQLATFSQLEEQQKTSAAIADLIAVQNAGLVLGGLSQGASLVGKEVTYADPETQQFVTGVVTRVDFDPSGVLLTIGDHLVPVGNVVGISVATQGAGGSVTGDPVVNAPVPPATPPASTATSEEPASTEP